ncbi:1-deoxy-D-xylulose-5-phosphate synthase [Corynebacterium ulceribovis]|uniref:1-deoxy-D-xylulose-5-phosphate synthase n=1 Tax=Corynebacterium ulceribovis TaxID=487732 RepID=UPI00036B360D|nr:1-deoxy-D-xylulose-5-phosphate synthase [Corynebacterium ulceribovis]
MRILDRVSSPADIMGLSEKQMVQLAAEIRSFLVEKVSATGGHLGPNLGVVELTMALHRVFDSPKDPIIFDTGHQAYVHKILTGRRKDFDTLRKKDGLSGYPCRAESPHDWVESSHASASLSYADGLAKAFELRGETHRSVVAVVGDGALTGGMCWEALNNIAAGKDRSLVIVVNDNGRSYAPTIGGFAENLSALRLQPGYDKVMAEGKSKLLKLGPFGKAIARVAYLFKEGVKEVVLPSEMFSDLGMKYIGPVDGHNIKSLENAMRHAKEYGGPVIVHAVTKKGHGFAPAESNQADLMHSTGVIDPITGESKSSSSGTAWTSVFADELIEIGAANDSVVAITAAMPGPTGLAKFGERFPDRMFDVGIAEQHAVTSASGLAMGGMKPVVAVYATFLNRAFDQMLMDVALLKQPVTFVLDRAGVTGSDGASHNGVWDMSICGIVPGIRVAAPRDGVRLQQQLREAVADESGPTVVRFPKGNVPAPIEAKSQFGPLDVLTGDTDSGDVLIVAVGPFAALALDAAKAVAAQGYAVTVVDPGWVVPVAPEIVELADRFSLVVTVEDGVIHGGVGSMIGEALTAAEVDTPLRHVAVPERFLDHASRSEVLEELGLTAASVARDIIGWSLALEDSELVDESKPEIVRQDSASDEG